ncbi:hypothetical protein XENOCAPTIV_013377 [Xenoophorus captivus]|uniref:Uncharacterized protein n=1 Tax=Xenoophorus captivus TaxID=1517983 RepID=A0ABV0QI35_9TELE
MVALPSELTDKGKGSRGRIKSLIIAQLQKLQLSYGSDKIKGITMFFRCDVFHRNVIVKSPEVIQKSNELKVTGGKASNRCTTLHMRNGRNYYILSTKIMQTH